MSKCEFSRLELSLWGVQFMLREARAWVAAGEIPTEAHQGASKAIYGLLWGCLYKGGPMLLLQASGSHNPWFMSG